MTPAGKRSSFIIMLVSIIGLLAIIATGGGDGEGDSPGPDISGLWSFTATLISLTNEQCLIEAMDIGDITTHAVTIISDGTTATLIFDDGTTRTAELFGDTLEYQASLDGKNGACTFTEHEQAQWTFEEDTLSGTWQLPISWNMSCICNNGVTTDRLFAISGERQ